MIVCVYNRRLRREIKLRSRVFLVECSGSDDKVLQRLSTRIVWILECKFDENFGVSPRLTVQLSELFRNSVLGNLCFIA